MQLALPWPGTRLCIAPTSERPMTTPAGNAGWLGVLGLVWVLEISRGG